eukprot:m.33299 g.33299  ORF g.33299 m.33299 type:complete len:265 (-) comp10871_c0_seq5:66-860(-)
MTEHGERWFDEMAKHWDDMPYIVTNVKNVQAQIRSHLAESGQDISTMSIMDVGAGSGMLSVALAKEAKEVLCVDTSAKMLEKAMEKATAAGLSNVQTLNEPLVSVDQLGGRTFDLVVMSMVLHHIDDIQAITRTISASLKPGGKFLVFDFEKFEGSASFHLMTEEQLKAAGVHHRDGFSPSDFEALFTQAGLKCVHAQSHFRMTMPDKMPGQEHAHSHAHAHGHSHEQQHGHAHEEGGHGHSHRQGLGPDKNEYPIIFAVGLKE